MLPALALTALLLTALAGCRSGPDGQRIPLSEAEALVRAWVFQANPSMNPDVSINLEERTSQEIWSRLGVQVFRLADDFPWGTETFVIANRQVTQLGTAWGGYGVTQMHVTDLNLDGTPELTYTYSFGSGIHRSEIAMFIPDTLNSNILTADLVYWQGDYLLEKRDDQTVFVYSGQYDLQTGAILPDLLIGRVSLGSEEGQPALQIELAPGLPSDILERLTAR